jgi:hypothetical protein
MAFDPNQPRDNKGEWSSSGGATHAAGVDKVGRVDLSNLPPSLASLKTAVDRGAFKFDVANVRDSYGSTTTTLSIIPDKIPPSWQQTESKYGSKYLYDPAVAKLDKDGFPQPKDPKALTELPTKGEEGLIYRGMSHEEFEGAIRAGAFGSKGEYNIGMSEDKLTFFSTSPRQAESYANGFAPWQFTPTPERPAVVVAIKDPGNHAKLPHLGGDTTEVGLEGKISSGKIDHVFIGKPYDFKPGNQDVINDKYHGMTPGSGSSPRASVIWKKIKMKAT